MENVMRTKNQQMGRSKPEFRCQKHTTHNQSPGVCSVCLRERLSQLSTASYMVVSSCSSSSSSHYSSLQISPSSQLHLRSKGSVSNLLKSGRDVLTKSRSMVFVAGMRGEAVEGKKKLGFWSKLLGRRGKRVDGDLAHSVNMREMMSTRL